LVQVNFRTSAQFREKLRRLCAERKTSLPGLILEQFDGVLEGEEYKAAEKAASLKEHALRAALLELKRTRRPGGPFFVAVAQAFHLGPTPAAELCELFGLEPLTGEAKGSGGQ
jgi:hypothetical protein